MQWTKSPFITHSVEHAVQLEISQLQQSSNVNQLISSLFVVV